MNRNCIHLKNLISYIPLSLKADVNSLAEEKIPVLQDRLRILSGLYGVLKPLDLIQPYRLEMGTKLKVDNTENLYKFWNNELANSLNEELEDDELLINLASAEYFKVIPAKALKVPMITPVFKDLKNGQYKIVMTYAKKARGLMVRRRYCWCYYGQGASGG